METTMTPTRSDRGSTDTTTIYSEGGDLTFERTFFDDDTREDITFDVADQFTWAAGEVPRFNERPPSSEGAPVTLLFNRS